MKDVGGKEAAQNRGKDGLSERVGGHVELVPILCWLETNDD